MTEKQDLETTPVEEQFTSDDGKLEASSTTAELYIDPAKETKLLAKLDIFFVPVIMLVYLSCFLDRSNIGESLLPSFQDTMLNQIIGNVKVAGMPADIGASTEQFSTAVSIFYATYVVFECPWAILLKKLTPQYLV